MGNQTQAVRRPQRATLLIDTGPAIHFYDFTGTLPCDPLSHLCTDKFPGRISGKNHFRYTIRIE